MGVHSFWDIVAPTARPVKLESLQDKKMAVDASIWIYQFIKAMRDSEGNTIKSAHITGFFRRICKLLYFGIKPVFVFDGGVPALKRDTIKQRNEARQGKRESAQRTARKLLALQIHKDANKVENVSKLNKQDKDGVKDIVFRPHDDWDLPKIEGFKVSKTDERVNLDYDKEKKKRKHESSLIDDTIDSLDLDSIDPTSEAFEELPKNLQYQLLSSLRMKSRLRMGYSKEQLENVFPDSLDFSRFQIDMVKRRNYYTQRIINMTGYHDGGASKLNDEVINRISGKKDRQYKITKTDNGWALGLGENDGSEAKKAVIVDGGTGKSNNLIDLTDGEHSTLSTTEKANRNDNDNNEDEEDDSEDWEDVELKPVVKKDTFDYSLKAGRLPELDKNSQQIGSQSFFDKVPVNESPTKRDRQITPFTTGIHEEVSDNEKSDDDEYARQIEEIEMMEAFQKSKLEQYQREKRINEEKEKLANKREQDKITTDAIETQQAIQEASSKEKPAPLSESKQNLDFIVGKLPNINLMGSESFLFSDKPADVTSKNDKETREKAKDVVPMPSWFNNDTNTVASNTDVQNAYSRSTFVDDKQTSTLPKEGANSDGYELLSGLNAQHLLEQQMEENDKEKDSQINNEVTPDVVAISDSESEHEIKDNEKTSNKNAIKNVSQSRDDNIVSNVPSSRKEQSADEPTNGEDQTKAMVFNYEFSEDEENDLVDNILQEERDFDTFRNKELLQNYKPPETVVNTAFLEDDLFKQQVKDKRDSEEVTTDMITDIQELLSEFGIPFITAPMEAEAQCAELLSLKLVDGIITDDSDVFLFGGTKVYRNLFHDRKYVEFYDSARFGVDLGIDRSNMIELALLLGSDYTNGIKGMGPVSSMEVIAEFGDLTKFKEWYEAAQFDKKKLENEPKFERDLRKRMMKNEVELDPNFPNELVVDAYMNPEVDHDTTPFTWGFPALDTLRNYLEDHLGWTVEKSDEVLLPLMKDINNRKKNKQRSIGEFFPTEYIESNSQGVSRGKRILTATTKLKKRRKQ